MIQVINLNRDKCLTIPLIDIPQVLYCSESKITQLFLKNTTIDTKILKHLIILKAKKIPTVNKTIGNTGNFLKILLNLISKT